MTVPLLGGFLMDTGEPIGLVPPIISIASRSSSILRTPEGTEINNEVNKGRNYLRIKKYIKCIHKFIPSNEFMRKNEPTILANWFIVISENRMWLIAAPSFARMFLPSFESHPTLSQADFAHRIALKIFIFIPFD